MTQSNAFDVECAPELRAGSKITICGEAPGNQEVASFRKNGTPGHPFVGGSGNMLNRILGNAGLTREEVNLTNVVKKQPPGNDFGVYYEDAKRTRPTPELLLWYDMLKLELMVNRPNVVVAAGDEALRALTAMRGITKYRGSLLPCTLVEGLKVVPMMHPAWVMRDNWEYFFINQLDMKKAAKESKSALLTYEPTELTIAPSLDQIVNVLRYISVTGLEWCVDVETRLDTLACFAIAVAEKDHTVRSAICVPIQDTTGPHWSPKNEAIIWKELAQAMAQNPKLTNQNITYDLAYITEDYGCEPSGLWMDTMLAFRLLYPEFPRGLNFITSLYTDIIYYKDEGKTWGSKTPDEDLWAYCCKDVIATLRSAFCIEAELRQRKLWQFYLERLHPRLGWAMEMHKMRLRRLDSNYINMKDILEREIVKAQYEVNNLNHGIHLNVFSSVQVAHRLYDDLGLPAQTVKRGKGEYAKRSVSTKEDVLRELRMSYPDIPDLNAIIKARHLRTRLTRYFNSVSFDVDGYLPYSMHPEGTDTLRWSGGPSSKWRGGPSPQTIPSVVRQCYGPPPGRAFIQVDQSQSQARMVAWLSNCKVLKEIFRDPKRHIHKEMTAKLYNLDPDDVVKGSPQYDLSKSMVHAANYRMSPKTLSIKTGIPLHEAKTKMEYYFEDKMEIPKWHDQVKADVIRTGRLKNTFGYERWFYTLLSQIINTGKIGEHEWTEACVFIPQSTDALITDICIKRVLETLDYARVHQHGHDSALFSVPDEPKLIAECAEFARDAMTATLFMGGDTLIIPSDAGVGYNWFSMMPYNDNDKITRDVWEMWINERDKEGNTREGTEKLVELLHGIY